MIAGPSISGGWTSSVTSDDHRRGNEATIRNAARDWLPDRYSRFYENVVNLVLPPHGCHELRPKLSQKLSKNIRISIETIVQLCHISFR